MAIKPNHAAGIEYFDFAPDGYQQTVIILHGYGADAADLMMMAKSFDTKVETRWIFPNGVEKATFGAYTSGFAWYQISRELGAAMDARQYDQLSKSTPKGLVEVRNKLLSFLKELDLDVSKTVMGGFSQGAIVTVDLALHLPVALKGMILFSSTLVNSEEWRALAPQKKGLRFFQSHGVSDPVLPVEYARKLEGLLTGSGLKGKLETFQGAHEIPDSVIEKASDFLDQLS